MRRGKSRKIGPPPRFPDFPLLCFSDFPKKRLARESRIEVAPVEQIFH